MGHIIGVHGIATAEMTAINVRPTLMDTNANASTSNRQGAFSVLFLSAFVYFYVSVLCIQRAAYITDSRVSLPAVVAAQPNAARER